MGTSGAASETALQDTAAAAWKSSPAQPAAVETGSSTPRPGTEGAGFERTPSGAWDASGGGAGKERRVLLDPVSQRGILASRPLGEVRMRLHKRLQAAVNFNASVSGWDKTMKMYIYTARLIADGIRLCGGGEGGAADACAALKTTAEQVHMTRLTTKMGGGSYGVVFEATTLLAPDTGGWEDPCINWLLKAQAWSMMLYFPLEHLWLLSRVLPTSVFDRWFAPSLSGVWVGGWTGPERTLWGNTLARRYSILWVFWNMSGIAGSLLRLRELRVLRARWAKMGKLSKEVAASLKKTRDAALLQTVRHVLYFFNAVARVLPPGHRFQQTSTTSNILGLGEAVLGSYQMVSGLMGKAAPKLPLEAP